MKNLISWFGMLGILFLLGVGVNFPADQEEIVIDKDNIVIDKSVKIKPGTYKIEDADNNGVLHISKDGVTVDFQGAELWGCDSKMAAEKRKGTGISISGCKKVTIRNAKVHGFFFNVQVKECEEIVLEHCNTSSSRAERLKRDNKDVGIFLHLRSLASWRSYGAGIWMEKCTNSIVRNCTSQEAQNGIILADSNRCQLAQNDFSFNSGWGVGLWNSCENLVIYNLVDFCNRPYGGSWGGDSSGVVMASSSHRNWIVANSLTHGGDGFFLTHEKTIKEGDRKGICNDNVIAFNDGSYSPNNAFESTFSLRNCFIGNLANNSNYGFWCGFSCNNLLAGNEINGNRTHGIAIEHGNGTRIECNKFSHNNNCGIALWMDPAKAKKGEPASKDYVICNNLFAENKIGIHLKETGNVRIERNHLLDGETGLQLAKGVKEITATDNHFEINKNGKYFIEIKEGNSDVDARRNYWDDSKKRKLSQLIHKGKGSVDTENALSGAPKLEAVPKRLTFAGGMDAMKAGDMDEIIKELTPFLNRVDCKIDTKVSLPKMPEKFKMYKDSGGPLGMQSVKCGEYFPLQPTR